MVEPTANGPLHGVRVLEIAQAMAMPMCGLMLADMGADVIKIEPPEGDAFRHNQSPIFPSESKGYVVLNRGKRSFCLDITQADARPVIERLVKQSDIVLMSLKPKDLPRYRLTYEDLRAIRSDVIVVEHWPVGALGPMGGDGGYDVIVQGLSSTGAITARANESGTAPESVRPAYHDNGTGFLSALGAVAALRHRDLTGEGQRVETSLLSTALAFGNNLVNWFAATDTPIWERFEQRIQEARAAGAGFEEQVRIYQKTIVTGGHGNIYFRHYRSKDGFVSLGALSPGLNRKVRALTGLHDPREEPGFELGTPEAWDALSQLVREAEDLFRTRTTAEWIAAFQAVSVPCGPFNFPPDVFTDPQIAANNYIIELEHEALGAYKTFAPPIRMDRTPITVRSASPLLDADTDAVLAELGFESDEVKSMRSARIVGRSV
jgi:formyl-CoA transferase